MLKYLIQVVRDSLAAGILLSALFSFARSGGGQKQRKWLSLGFAAGVASALALSVLKSATTLINREYWSIGVLSAAILAEIPFYALAWGAFQKKESPSHENALGAVSAVLAASLTLYSLPGIFLYPTEFLMSGESVFGTDFLFKAVGYLGGLLIVGLSGFALFRAGTSAPRKLTRVSLTIGLAVNMVTQIGTVLQFLLARRVIPMSKGIFGFVKLVVNYNEYFLYAIMAATILLPLAAWIKSPQPEETRQNPAQRRKIRAAARGRRRLSAIALAGYVLSILCLTVVKAYDGREVVLSPVEPINIVGDEIIIPLENVDDGHLHRFAHTASNGVEVRFIVVKKNEAAFGVGLDACDICGATGYYERENEVICKLCDVVMNKSTIGFKGGCNPVPLAYAVRDGGIAIRTQDLENEKKRFE
ncbi:MAG: Fe-S-containing protein [Clostridiales bacterium]|jgi:uncharacterized membrane protein|nr:Fe-S-containing protein [Clostridiales bacterium]